MKKTLLSVVLAVVLFAGSAFAQDGDLQKVLNQLAGPAVEGYINPIAQGLNTNFNGGLFHKAPQTKLFGIDFEIGLVVMGTPYADDEKTFSSAGKFTFNKSQADNIANSINPATGNASLDAQIRATISTELQKTVTDISISGPTAIGAVYKAGDPTSEVALEVQTPSITVNVGGVDRTYSLAGKKVSTGFGGIDAIQKLSMIPFAAPQLTLGTLLGTQVTVRYMPKYNIAELGGDLSWTGFGVQHNLGYFLPIPIVDVAASFYTQTLKIDPLFEMKGTAYGLNVSKQFGFGFLNATPYAGFMLENSKFTVHYTAPASAFDPALGVAPPSVNVEIEGKNTSRAVVGLSLRLFVININADYNFGKYKSFTGGVFFAF
ncbi:MAG: hypothetical protein KA247_00505 [Bacteroidetes bacterium]|nr:hypothetical protein [Bacteroidota bacterium]